MTTNHQPNYPRYPDANGGNGADHPPGDAAAVFLVATPQRDVDEWGCFPSRQPQPAGWRGSGLIQGSGEESAAGNVGRPVLATEARGVGGGWDAGGTLARTRALAFSNAPIPDEDLADMLMDPEMGPVVHNRMNIDLANRESAAQDRRDAMLGAWGRDHPAAVGSSDGAGNVDLANEVADLSAADEVSALLFLLSDDSPLPPLRSFSPVERFDLSHVEPPSFIDTPTDYTPWEERA